MFKKEFHEVFEENKDQADFELLLQRTHPEDRAAVQATVDRASIAGNGYDHEFRLLMPDGSVKYIHTLARAATDTSGGVEFLGAATDVTALVVDSWKKVKITIPSNRSTG